MRSNLVKATDDLSARARADRSIQSGRVLIVNKTTHTAILDVGMVDNDGNGVFLLDVPFSPQNPPQPNDTVAILRTNSSPYSHVIGSGAQVGGANSGQVVEAGGAVTSVNGQQGDLTLAPGAGMSVTRVGKTFSIALGATGVVPGAYTDVSLTVDATGRVVDVSSGSGGGGGSPSGYAPSNMHFLTDRAEGPLTNEVSLGALSTGMLKITVSSSVAVPTAGVVTVADGGTGASSPSGARTNLGVAIGTDVQAHDGDLDTIAGLTATTDSILQAKASAWSARTLAQVASDLQGASAATLAAGNDSRFTTVAGNNQTGTTYTFVMADAGKVVEGNNASAITFTIPPVSSVAWPVGTVVEVFQQGAGQITLAAGAGVTLRSDGGKVKTTGQYASVGLRMRASDEWVLSGDLA